MMVEFYLTIEIQFMVEAHLMTQLIVVEQVS